MKTKLASVALATTLVACASPNYETEAAARIVKACVDTTLFRQVGNSALSAVPQTAIPAALLKAGVDYACAHPEQVAGNAAAVNAYIQVLRNFAKKP